jgi:SHS2 domain-containing protein
MTHALQEHAALGLAAAKAVTDRVLERKAVEVTLPSRQQAEVLADTLRALGAECAVIDPEPAS